MTAMNDKWEFLEKWIQSGNTVAQLREALSLFSGDAPAPTPAPAPAPTPTPVPDTDGGKLVENALKNFTQTLQGLAAGMPVPQPKQRTADDVLAEILNPKEV